MKLYRRLLNCLSNYREFITEINITCVKAR